MFGEKIEDGYDWCGDLISSAIVNAAMSTGATLVNLRATAREYLLRHNVRTGDKGGLEWGILTADTVHPCHGSPPCDPHTHGNYLIADGFAKGIIDAVSSRRAQ